MKNMVFNFSGSFWEKKIACVERFFLIYAEKSIVSKEQ